MSPVFIHHNFFMQDSPSAWLHFSILMVFSSRREPVGIWMARANEDPSCCANVPAIFESWRGMANPRTTMPITSGFWIQHMNGWRWLLIFLSAQLAQSETAVNLLSNPIFCLYFGVLPGFVWFYSILQSGNERIFRSLHTKHPPVPVFLSGVTGLFLHVRCTPQRNSQWQFWASVWLMLDSSRWHKPFGEYLSK